MIRKATLNNEGISVKDLLQLIHTFAPSANPQALVGKPENVESLPVPSILFIDNHCVVYDGLAQETGKVRIFEPVTQKLAIEPIELVHRFWGGEAICFANPQMTPRAYVAAIMFVAILVVSSGACLMLLKSTRDRKDNP